MAIHPILSTLLRNKTGPILVALQVALSLAILANALHVVNLRQQLALRPSGLHDEASLLYLRVTHLVKGSHAEQLARQQAEAAALRAVGGVVSVAIASHTPMSWYGSTTSVTLDRQQKSPLASVSFYVTADSLVSTFGLKLIEGRDFVPADVLEIDAAVVAHDVFPASVIVTRQLADKLWPGAPTVIGKTILFGTGPNAHSSRVVGVVEMLQTSGAQLGPEGYFSVISPARATNAWPPTYVVRAEPGQRDRVMKEAEAALRKTSASPMIIKTHSIEQDRKDRYRADRALAWMLVAVSVLLLLVTVSGIVGMASLWVNQRRKQIGVRRALGARRVDILRHFLAENFMITSVGIGGGVLLALALNHQLVTRLEMARLPAGYLGTGAVLLWALGALAAFGPAWRAARTSPAIATRTT